MGGGASLNAASDIPSFAASFTPASFTPIQLKSIVTFSKSQSQLDLANSYNQYIQNQHQFENARDKFLNNLNSSLTQKLTREKLNALEEQAKKLTQKTSDLNDFFQKQIKSNDSASSGLDTALQNAKNDLNSAKTTINNNLEKGLSNTTNGFDFTNANDLRDKLNDVISKINSLSYVYEPYHRAGEADYGIKTGYNGRTYWAQDKDVNLSNFVIDFKSATINKSANPKSPEYALLDLGTLEKSIKNLLKTISTAHTAIDNAQKDLKKTDLNNVLAAQNNVSNNNGETQAYTKAKEEIQKELDELSKDLQTQITSINASLSGTDAADVEEQLATAKKNLKDSIANFSAKLQAASDLEQMQQVAFKTLSNEQQSLSKLSMNASLNMSKLNFASSMATSARLAKLSNPKSQDKRFAQWIESIKNKPLADNTNLSKKSKNTTQANNAKANTQSDVSHISYLSNAIYNYETLRLNKTNNLWGSIGAILGNSKSINTFSTTFSFGYDAWVRNMILGVYGSYAYTSNGLANLDSKASSHNGDLGFYSRFFLGNNEIDLTLGENVGFNMFDFREALLNTALESSYLALQTHLDLTYGYVFSLNKGWFSKPFIGVHYNYGYNLGMQARSKDIAVGFDDFQTHFIAFDMGLELRKYFNDNESYFFVAPAFYQGALLDNTQKMQTRIYDTSLTQSVSEFEKNNSIDSSFILKVGGEWQATKNVYLNIAVGAKLGNLNQYGMLSLGGRWVF